MRSASVALFDVCQHIVNGAYGELMLGCSADNRQLLAHVAYGLLPARALECLPYPFSNRHVARTGHALNFPVLRLFENDLQTFSHYMSLYDSYG